ncbi:kinase-like protein, partial [Glonium stellatum]
PGDITFLSETASCERIIKLLGYQPQWPNQFRDGVILEYCGEGDLFKYFERRWTNHIMVTEDTMWRVFTQLMEALAYLHQGHGSGRNKDEWKPIVHRDIKPENIMLVSSDNTPGSVLNLKLADFGVSAFYDPNNCSFVNKGTPTYQPPEQVNGKATPAGDVWAVGAIIHFMGHGVRPHVNTVDFAREWRKANPGVTPLGSDRKSYWEQRATRLAIPLNQDKKEWQPTYSD